MHLGQSQRYFKLLAVVVVFTLVFLIFTRKNLPETSQNIVYRDTRENFINLVNERLASLNRTKTKDKNGLAIDLGIEDVDVLQEDESQLNIDDRMPSAYLRFHEPETNINKSYCKFNYDLPHDFQYRRYDFPPSERRKSPYRVLYNVTEAYNIEDVPKVTYATHVTANFAYYIPELLRYWNGLISVAAFVPDLDAALFLEQINQYCYCEPEMYRVSIHIVVPQSLPISKKDIYFDPPDSCTPIDSSKIQVYSNFDDTTIYPINVCRNVARTSSLTKYVLLSDVQLMPSKDMASGFLKMIETYDKTDPKEVFVLPIFEVAETEFIPETKEDLRTLIANSKAVYFHGMICKHCQKFPGIEEWVDTINSTEIEPFITLKRHYPYHRWEPIFIGTNAEPLFNEQLSWEGLQDKMLNSLEMCVQDYDFTILDNAFLTHWPGIRTEKLKTEDWRTPYINQNMAVYNVSIEVLKKKYTYIEGCSLNSTMNLHYISKKHKKVNSEKEM
ncbi:beta-1,4-glucuronyltransferase 1-like [Sitophilus oryzae]|uniref:Beta-1,4-glucuronyltransferase 1-like n=1 Tax=Sitophilus oryzae TaxID=7048 RepID=A0A6J2YHV3_SITOR|nr:beta-1,4-glucuronyltransferase 1-like [Sitophilus oryzae]